METLFWIMIILLALFVGYCTGTVIVLRERSTIGQVPVGYPGRGFLGRLCAIGVDMTVPLEKEEYTGWCIPEVVLDAVGSGSSPYFIGIVDDSVIYVAREEQLKDEYLE